MAYHVSRALSQRMCDRSLNLRIENLCIFVFLILENSLWDGINIFAQCLYLSPVFLYSRNHTPILLIHGTSDQFSHHGFSLAHALNSHSVHFSHVVSVASHLIHSYFLLNWSLSFPSQERQIIIICMSNLTIHLILLITEFRNNLFQERLSIYCSV